MLQAIRSFIGSVLRGDKSLADFDALKTEVGRILKLDLTTPASRHLQRDCVFELIRRFERDLARLKQKEWGMPENSISFSTWANGVGYATLASELTHHFRAAGWLECEEAFSSLWVKATLAVCSHYKHMVGPAMLAKADCQDRLGNKERAMQICSAIVKDFSPLVENWQNNSQPIEDMVLDALESLKTATEYLLTQGLEDLDGISVASLHLQTSSILNRTDPN